MLQIDISYYHTKYHCDSTLRFEDIQSRNYNELYRKKFQSPLWRHFRSDRYETFHRFQLCNCIANLKEIGRYLRKLKIWRFWCISIVQNTTGTGSCSSLRIDIKNLPCSSLSNATIFIPIRQWVPLIKMHRRFRDYAYISGTGSAIARIWKTIFNIHILYIMCKFQLCSPNSSSRKLMLE